MVNIMERVLLIDGVEDLRNKQVFKGLFGDDLVIVDDGEEEKPTVSVTTKLTPTEAAALEGWAYKFGISKAKMMRDMIKQQMKDLTTLHDL